MKYLNIISLILMILIPLIIFLLIKDGGKIKSKKFSIKSAENNLKKSEKGLKLYGKTEEYLSRMGVAEIFEKEISPIEFYLIKIGLALIVLILCIRFGLFISLLGTVIGFLTPNFVLWLSNEGDNDEILIDIRKVYDILEMQTRAGVFLTNSLNECYLCVKNERLKKAFLDFNNEILLKNDIEKAVNNFQLKFKSQYIDTFCIVIKQSLDSGKSVQILEDLSAQIVDIDEAIQMKKQNEKERKTSLYQLILFTDVMIVVLYLLIQYLLKTFQSF